MSTVESVLVVAFLMPLLLAISWVREELRIVEPKARFGFGIAALLGSAVALLLTLTLLPEPAAIEDDLFLMTLLMGGISICAGGFILSIVLISSATWQAFKRWKFYRSNVS